jgi:hypothetical protein
MGLPPDLPVALDDSLIVQFQLLDPELTSVARQLSMLRTEVGQFQVPEIPTVEQLTIAINQTGLLAEQIGAHFESVYKDYATLDERAPKRESRMTPDEVQAFRKVITDYKAELAQLESDFATLLDETVKFDQSLSEANREQSYGILIRLLGEYDALIGNLSLVQARARLESVTLDPVQMESEQALVIAETNRFDVMNSRAALVDSWRLISFNANRLKSFAEVRVDGDISTIGDNPLKFRAPTGSFFASVQFDAPFTRLLERNNYRQQLIDYNSNRRDYIQFIDGINQTLRGLLRDLEQLEKNLEIQRRAAAISIRRVDLNRENLREPKPPTEPGQPPAQFGDTAATDLLTALSDLRNTQNNFMSVWLNHYATRMALERDLGTMMVDGEGRWIDSGGGIPRAGQTEELELPPPVPPQLIQELNEAAAAAHRRETAAAEMSANLNGRLRR